MNFLNDRKLNRFIHVYTMLPTSEYDSIFWIAALELNIFYSTKGILIPGSNIFELIFTSTRKQTFTCQ